MLNMDFTATVLVYILKKMQYKYIKCKVFTSYEQPMKPKLCEDLHIPQF
jgi:hypothetical protein